MSRLKLCWLVGTILVFAACSDESNSSTTTLDSPTTSSTSRPTTSQPTEELPECMAGPGTIGLENRYETIQNAYNARNAASLIALVGDGPVLDSSLNPRGPDLYEGVADWLDAAGTLGDLVSVNGYSPGDPLQLFLERRNATLEAEGIESVAVTFHFWTNQDCRHRVEVSDPISAPDPCRYYRAFEQEPPQQCGGPFEPRSSHVAVWTGSEVLIYGGIGSTTDTGELVTGQGFDPNTGSWRTLSPSPVAVSSWPTMDAMWTGSELHIVGATRVDQEWPIVVLTYTPETDTWEVSPRRPTEPGRFATPGAAVWTGSEVVVAGGDTNAPAKEAWAYDPALQQWRQIDDMPAAPMEGVEAVVAGDTAYFVGGYPGAPAAALDLTSLEWREIADVGASSLEHHQMVWTGELLIVIGGHAGPSHVDRLRIYQPGADTWTDSSPMPILASERGDAVWTGTELIVWGGFATYGEAHDEDGDYVLGDGAAYDPATDTWRILSDSPLADRCDHTLTWTGSAMLVFGGLPVCGDPNVLAYGDAARYDPAADTWRLVEP